MRVRRAGTSFDLNGVRSAYFRRPTLLLDHSNVASEYRALRSAEWLAAVEALQNLLGDRWFNSPEASQRSEDKVLQLRSAALTGFAVPSTVVTNDPSAAIKFADGGRTVLKPLRHGSFTVGGSEQLIFTREVGSGELRGEATRALPAILQRLVVGVDVRVAVVDTACFAAAIVREGSSSEPDWRRDDPDRLIYRAHDLPREVAERCTALVKRLGLRFGAIDLMADADGTHWFLEVNPSGQWAWLEKRLDLGISAALAAALAA